MDNYALQTDRIILHRQSLRMSDDEIRHFQNLLRAVTLGWPGDPLCQPPTSVLAAYRQLQAEREAWSYQGWVVRYSWNR
jgi:hypothetical protein